MSEDDRVRIDTRLAGQLKRYHTWPITGQQTVAEHCWQILRIYYSVVDIPDLHMVYYIIFHDIGETATGDLPYPVKSQNNTLKAEADSLEQRSMYSQLQYWGSFQQTMLTDEDKKFFKQIELIEMAEFGMDQVCLGNSHGFIVADRCLHAVFENQPCQKLVQYVIKRIRLFFDQCVFFVPGKGDWWSAAKWERLHARK